MSSYPNSVEIGATRATATILLVGDAPDLSQVIQRELALAGYRVLRAGDGAAAIRLFITTRPDLLILDCGLSGISSLDPLQELGRESATPVLMLKAPDSETERAVGRRPEVGDYLIKPFGMGEFIARVQALLQRAETAPPSRAADRGNSGARLSYGLLALNPAAYQVTINGIALELTRTEFALLHLLMRNPGRAFSRTYLLDTIWGETCDSGDRSVDNAIFRLRKKLGPLGGAIETVWSVGYRLRPAR